jgi:hypothetical protein
MNDFVEIFRYFWLMMLTPPWRDVQSDEAGGDKFFHVIFWLVGWIWALTGIILGAVLSPYLLEVGGVADSPYQDVIVIGIATIAGFFVQFLGWLVVTLFGFIVVGIIGPLTRTEPGDIALFLVLLIALPLPLIGAGYGIYLYAAKIGIKEGFVSVGVIGGVLVKLTVALGLPLLKTIIVGFIFARFMIWLRGSNK